MSHPSRASLILGTVVVAPLLAVACQRLVTTSQPFPARSGHATVSIGGYATLGAPLFRAGWLAVVPVPTTQGISLSGAQLVVTTLKAAHDERGCGATGDDASIGGGCQLLASGPTVVTIPVNGSLTSGFDAVVDAGAYRALDGELGGASDSSPAGRAFQQRHPNFAHGVSLRAVGAYTDSTGRTSRFIFTSALDRRIIVRFARPVDVDASGAFVTLSVDVPRWFRDDAGRTLNPADPRNRPVIERNILASFQAFEDGDHDGRSDVRPGVD